MSTSRPDSAPVPVPDADRTVRLAQGGESVRPGPGGGDGDAEVTVRLAQGGDGAEGGDGGRATVRLGSGPVAPGRTVRPDRPAAPPVPGTGGPDAEATVRIDPTEAAGATFLDPRVWGGAAQPAETTAPMDTPAYGSTVPGPPPPGAGPAAAATPATGPAGGGPEAERPFAPGELRRFGPGVPPQAAAVWHGRAVPGAEEPRRGRRVRRWLVPVAVLAAVLALLFWRLRAPDLAVTGVGVTSGQETPGCGGTAVITATVETNGGAGTLRYRWLRSDGTTSGEILQDVRSGAHRTELVLRWSFEGRGALEATATLEILSPQARTTATSFPYRCS
ncbi:hypothetical protein ACFVYP_04730 [Kitasatospora sp. NPDC058201]|uniref:hypothetical protein n=1 Tax=unclassified Kitasatospora TaxID=2633591 RepID=UPI0036591CFA